MSELRAFSREELDRRDATIDAEIRKAVGNLSINRRIDPTAAQSLARLTAERRKVKMVKASDTTATGHVDEETARYAF